MGFRNPITTATDVDTRTTIGRPGIYTTETVDGSGNTTASLHLTDGFAADAEALLSRTAAVNTHTQGQSLTGGVAVKGGSYGGVTAPELDLSVESAAAGGTQAVGRLRGGVFYTADAPLVVEAHPAPLKIGGTPSLYQNAWQDLGGTNAPLIAWLLPTGRVELSGAIKNAGNLAAGANVVVCQLPTWARPTYYMIKMIRVAGSPGRLDIDNATGNVIWLGNSAYSNTSDIEVDVGWPGPQIVY
jgi:hypothetical protein